MIDLRNHYGFNRLPFGKDLAPCMLHQHAGCSEAAARIGWCITERALGVITGEVGAGKTVAARAAVAALDQTRHTLIYLANPTTGTRGLHYQIVIALGGRPAHGTAALTAQAAGLLAAEHSERARTPVVVIDEAHLLDHDQLEAIRMLTNDQMDAASPLACLLLGQPTLRRMLRLGVLAALDQRIALRYAIPAMTPAETASYITHHLKLAGRSDPLFSDDAITLTHEAARGLPRAVNNIALQSLVAAYAGRKPSSTRPAPGSPSPKSRQTDHHPASKHATAPPATHWRGRGAPHVPISNDAYILILNDRQQGIASPNAMHCRPGRGAGGSL